MLIPRCRVFIPFLIKIVIDVPECMTPLTVLLKELLDNINNQIYDLRTILKIVDSTKINCQNLLPGSEFAVVVIRLEQQLTIYLLAINRKSIAGLIFNDRRESMEGCGGILWRF